MRKVNQMYKIFANKLFGVKMERVTKTLAVWFIVFLGLHLADFHLAIAPFILYLMVSSVSAGVMWQALASDDNAENIKNMFMMPFDEKRFIFAYVSVLGIYTILTKTLGLIAVVIAVSTRSGTEILGSVLCMINAILMTACAYAARKHWVRCAARSIMWGAAVMAVIFLLWDSVLFLPMLSCSALLAVMLLAHVDAYSFYLCGSRTNRVIRKYRRASVWRYLLRYMMAHRNYLVNTAVMWLVACVLPVFLGRLEGVIVMPIGFAILSLNTPICILLSCDPDLEQAIRFLPGQKTAFGVPYCLFIFLMNMAADFIFLGSWYVINGSFVGEYGMKNMDSMSVYVILTAVFFALQSAVGSVFMEWFYPVKNWKIESDLWHHPRKYIVPALMLLLAGVVGTAASAVPALMIGLLVEVTVLLIRCRR